MDISKSSTFVKQYQRQSGITSARQMKNIGREINRLSMSRDVSKTPTGYHYQVAGTPSQPHRFGVGGNDTNSVAADVDTGGWNQNGVLIVDTGGTANIGDTTNPYLIATITQGTANPLVPTAISIAASSAVAADSDFTTKRTIAKINYDSNSNRGEIDRYQVGDIYQRLDATETSAGSWTDGGKGGTTKSFVSSIQYDDSAHKLQAKFTDVEVKNGSTYIHLEDTAWTDITTAAACP